MSDQIPDGLHKDGKGYYILNATPGLFSPWDHGIEPEEVSTNNYSGYIALFDIREGYIYLHHLSVGHTPARRKPPTTNIDDIFDIPMGSAPLPELNGVKASRATGGYFDYESVNLPLDYTGTLTLAETELVSEQERSVTIMSFKNGRLVNIELSASSP